MNLSINQSYAMPVIDPAPVTAEDIARMTPEGYFATRQLASVSTTETAVEVTTAQGDQVTLTYRSSIVDYTYLRPEGMDVPELIDGQVSSETMSIAVQGELSREEQDDMAALQKDLAALISGDPEKAGTGQSLLSGYDTLSRFTLTTRAAKARASAGEMTVVPDPAYNARTAEQAAGLLENAARTDQVATFFSLIV